MRYPFIEKYEKYQNILVDKSTLSGPMLKCLSQSMRLWLHMWCLFLPHLFLIFPSFGASVDIRKHAYSNILENSPPKAENFQIKNDIFHTSTQNKGCGYSLEPPR